MPVVKPIEWNPKQKMNLTLSQFYKTYISQCKKLGVENSVMKFEVFKAYCEGRYIFKEEENEFGEVCP